MSEVDLSKLFSGMTVKQLLVITPQELARVKLNAYKALIVQELQDVILRVESEEFETIPIDEFNGGECCGYIECLKLDGSGNLEEMWLLLKSLKEQATPLNFEKKSPKSCRR